MGTKRAFKISQAFFTAAPFRSVPADAAVAANARLPVLPGVPTFAEEGYKDMEFGTMFSLLAPAGTPAAVIDALYKAIKDASANPGFNEKIAQQGGYMVVNTPADFDKYIREDVAKWAGLIKRIGGVGTN